MPFPPQLHTTHEPQENYKLQNYPKYQKTNVLIFYHLFFYLFSHLLLRCSPAFQSRILLQILSSSILSSSSSNFVDNQNIIDVVSIDEIVSPTWDAMQCLVDEDDGNAVVSTAV